MVKRPSPDAEAATRIADYTYMIRYQARTYNVFDDQAKDRRNDSAGRQLPVRRDAIRD
jgi:hypothetical protein